MTVGRGRSGTPVDGVATARSGLGMACAAAGLLLALAPGGWAAPADAAAPGCSGKVADDRDFSGKDLSGENFHAYPKGALVGAHFDGAKLRGAVFAGTDLTDACFNGADLGPGAQPVDFTEATLTGTTFVGARLDGADFSYAEITCADFSKTTLRAANFGPRQDIRAGKGCKTRFADAELDIHLIARAPDGTHNWKRSDFTGATLHNLNAGSFDLKGVDIAGAVLAELDFTGIDMSGANLSGVDFSNSRLDGARLDRTALNGAVFDGAVLTGASFVCAHAHGTAGGTTRQDGASCPTPTATGVGDRAVSFRAADLRDVVAVGARFDHAVFAGATTTNADFTNASLVQTTFAATDAFPAPASVANATFAGTDFSSANLQGVQFDGGILTRATFTKAQLVNTRFTGAEMPGADFAGTTLQDVDFAGANLRNASFDSATARLPAGRRGYAVNFRCSRLGGADFGNARLTSANFLDAVMPPGPDSCCPAKGSGKPWCGRVAGLQAVFPPVTYPPMQDKDRIQCPDGAVKACGKADWKLAPDWKSAGCGSGGIRRTMWSRPACDGSGGDVVDFADAALEACILASLPGDSPNVLRATAERVRQVNCPGKGIASVAGLEAFTALGVLDLSNNALTGFDLTFESGGERVESRLIRLDLSGNKLSGALSLLGHSALIRLEVADNQLTSIELDADAEPLTLNAAGNELTAFNLSYLTSLSYVDLSRNRLSDVTGGADGDLGFLKALAYLDLSHNDLTAIGGIDGLAQDLEGANGGGALRSLQLACNARFRCSGLGLVDASRYPALGDSQCVAFQAGENRWQARTHPACPTD